MEKSEQITFRITEKQKVWILKRAIELNMKVAEYVRYLIMKDLEEPK